MTKRRWSCTLESEYGDFAELFADFVGTESDAERQANILAEEWEDANGKGAECLHLNSHGKVKGE